MKYQKGTFVVVPNKHVLEGQIPSVLAVYFWICDHADENGVCRPARRTIARKAKVVTDTVDRAIKKLEELGILEKRPRMKNGEKLANEYQLLLEGGWPHDRGKVAAFQGQGVAAPDGYRTQPNMNSTQGTQPAPASPDASLVVSVIDAFKEVNPNYRTLFGRPPQRGAARRLVEIHGLERVLRVVAFLPKSNAEPFLPTITTPCQLEEKWAALEAGARKLKARQKREFVL